MSSGPIQDALGLLGVERLVLGIHAVMFPPGSADVGHGAPASDAWLAFLEWARELGFDGIQLGPEGQVTDFNPSPYDGSAFSRNVRAVDLGALVSDGLLGPEELAELRGEAPAQPGEVLHPEVLRADPARAGRAVRPALQRIAERSAGLDPRLSALRERESSWLEADVFFEAWTSRLGHDDPARFDAETLGLLAPDGATARAARAGELGAELAAAELGQLLAHEQQAAFHRRASELGVALFGDLQVGHSHRDRLLRAGAFLPGYLMGAPPSRTNPEGQPWGYPLLHPAQLDAGEGPAVRLLTARLEKMLRENDGLRLDHPHGLVCPWAYRDDPADPHAAVRAGARLRSAPDLPDHPDLARWAFVGRDQLSRRDDVNRWDEDWVAELEATQIERYARTVDRIVEIATARGLPRSAVLCEVLSTCPRPLLEVLRRHGLGRFRVVQKAKPDVPGDVYRTDQAQPEDWVLPGNHDTPPLAAVLETWQQNGRAEPWAAYLAERIGVDAATRGVMAGVLRRDRNLLGHALLADCLACPARHVYVFVGDLFGERTPFNRPGVVDAGNWTLRVPERFAQEHAERVRHGRALSLSRALALAVRSRGGPADLVQALEQRALSGR